MTDDLNPSGRRQRTTRSERRRPSRATGDENAQAPWSAESGAGEPGAEDTQALASEAAESSAFDTMVDVDTTVEEPTDAADPAVEIAVSTDSFEALDDEDARPTREIHIVPMKSAEDRMSLPRMRAEDIAARLQAAKPVFATGVAGADRGTVEPKENEAPTQKRVVVAAQTVIIAPARIVGASPNQSVPSQQRPLPRAAVPAPAEVDASNVAASNVAANDVAANDGAASSAVASNVAASSAVASNVAASSAVAGAAVASSAVASPSRAASHVPAPPVAVAAVAPPTVATEDIAPAEGELVDADHDALPVVDVEVADLDTASSSSSPSRTPPPPPPAETRAKPLASPKRPPPPPAPPPGSAMASQPTPAPRTEEDQKKRKQARQWWERFFSEDYLLTVPTPTPAQISRQVDFIVASLGLERGATILDVGCGLGLHCLELSRRGFLVVGLDLSLAMITRAAETAQQQNLKINFLHADIREMQFDGSFDAVISLGTTFGFFDDDANRDVLVRLHQALKPGGRLLLDVVNRDYVISLQPNLVWFEGEECVCMEESDFNYFTSRLTVKRTLMREDGRQANAEYALRLYSLHELGLLVQQMGFRVIEVSGQEAIRGAFFGACSPRIVMLAERRPANRLSTVLPPERASAEVARPSVALPPERASAEVPKPPKA